MTPDQRRIVAVEAHRRRSGRCPVRLHSLGTGETFEINPLSDGFVDVASGVTVRSNGTQIALPTGAIELWLVGDIFFEGVVDGAHFTGRAGGGASVTLYDENSDDYFQYTVVAEGDWT